MNISRHAFYIVQCSTADRLQL